MVVTAHQARTSFVLGGAATSILMALLLTPRGRTTCEPPQSGVLSARMMSTKVLAGDHAQDIAVTIRMTGKPAAKRPPFSLAIVIDRSTSMEGEPLMNAKAAAAQLVDQLAPTDAFSVVTYSSSDETVIAMTRATPDNKAAARRAIFAIREVGNTCISCGLDRGARELDTAPVEGGLRRLVLISDGQANVGLPREELPQLAAETAARGISITAVGVGLDFDEVTMTRIADRGHGHYYFVEDTSTLAAMFADELAGLTETVAHGAVLEITDRGGRIEEALGYPIERAGDTVRVPIADLRAGETRKVVLRSAIATTELGTLAVADFKLTWRRTSDGSAAMAEAHLATTLVRDRRAVDASIDPAAVNAIESARAARALEEATSIYEQQGAEAAQRQLDRHMRDVRVNKNLDSHTKRAIEKATSAATSNFATSPAPKATKATRNDAYNLAH
jgi:Ca-activated chloride channel family protein